jgi:hypothetical protein
MPNARMVAMDSGHVPHQSHMEPFNQHVLAFLRALNDRP